MSLGKESPYIFSKLDPFLIEGILLILALSMAPSVSVLTGLDHEHLCKVALVDQKSLIYMLFGLIETIFFLKLRYDTWAIQSIQLTTRRGS